MSWRGRVLDYCAHACVFFHALTLEAVCRLVVCFDAFHVARSSQQYFGAFNIWTAHV